MKRFEPILLLGLVWVCISCGPDSGAKRIATDDHEPTGRILAVVGTEVITAQEFARELERRSRGLTSWDSPEQRARLLDELIRVKAALAKARAGGMDRDPVIQSQIEQLIAGRYLESEFTRWSASHASTPTDEDLASYYEQHASSFHRPATVRAGVLFLKTGAKMQPDNRAELMARAEELRARAQGGDGREFAQLVQAHSEDQATRYTGGDTGWLEEGGDFPRWPAEVVAAAFELKSAGAVAPVLVTDSGLFIVRLKERRDSYTRPFHEVREQVRFEIERRHRQDLERRFTAHLKDDLPIQINRDVFNSMASPPSVATSPPPGVPGG